jgi:hypothetical protein
MTGRQWLREQFEYENCEECGGDETQHDAIQISLGDYGGPYWFARCKKAEVVS